MAKKRRDMEYRLTMLIQGNWTQSTHYPYAMQTLWHAEERMAHLPENVRSWHRIEAREVGLWEPLMSEVEVEEDASTRYPDTTDRWGLWEVTCPVCGAPPGRLCINLRTGTTLPLRKDHSRGHPERQRHYVDQYHERQIAAWRATQAERTP